MDVIILIILVKVQTSVPTPTVHEESSSCTV